MTVVECNELSKDDDSSVSLRNKRLDYLSMVLFSIRARINKLIIDRYAWIWSKEKKVDIIFMFFNSLSGNQDDVHCIG